MVATIIWGNRKFCSLSLTFKAEARFRVKTKIRPEVTISEQFQPTLLMWKNTLFHDCGIWGVGEARLPVCRVLVLTHNFEMKRPKKTRLPVFAIWWLWLQRRQWQNCKSKQAVRFDSKPILFVVATRCRRNRKFHSFSDTFQAEARFRVKTKIRPEVTNHEQFHPTLQMWNKAFFHDCGIAEARFRVKTKIRPEATN